MSKARLITGLVFIFLVVIFAVQNYEVVEVNFLFWSFSMSRAILIFILLAVGFACGFIMKSVSSLKQ
ncbi:MAG: lipopolysaccharide assembly protein LapA domain-containing protein [Thermodesulfobacteriota bacterium]